MRWRALVAAAVVVVVAGLCALVLLSSVQRWTTVT